MTEAAPPSTPPPKPAPGSPTDPRSFVIDEVHDYKPTPPVEPAPVKPARAPEANPIMVARKRAKSRKWKLLVIGGIALTIGACGMRMLARNPITLGASDIVNAPTLPHSEPVAVKRLAALPAAAPASQPAKVEAPPVLPELPPLNGVTSNACVINGRTYLIGDIFHGAELKELSPANGTTVWLLPGSLVARWSIGDKPRFVFLRTEADKQGKPILFARTASTANVQNILAEASGPDRDDATIWTRGPSDFPHGERNGGRRAGTPAPAKR